MRLPLELIERLRALRPTAETPKDHVGFVATAAGVYFLVAAAIEVWRFLTADILLPVWRAVRPWLWSVVLVVWATNAWAAVSSTCATPPSGGVCVCDQKFQDTTYTTVVSGGGNYGAVLGNQDGSLAACRYDDVFTGTDLSVSWTFGAGQTFASMLQIASDSTTLNLLPNRDTGAVARYLRFASNNDNATIRFGHVFPGGTLPANLRRWAIRWYSYHSSNYEWVGDGTCSNGKIAHSSAGHQAYPMMTLTVHDTTDLYTFIDSLSGTDYHWLWSGHTAFQGFNSSIGPRPGASVDAHLYRGKWYRHEVVVSNPGTSHVGGYNFQYFVKNITDNTAEVEDIRFSSSCTGCMTANGIGGTNYTWDSSIHPDTDMYTLATEFYRADGCAGWQGWVYLNSTYWTTNAGQRIGAASEVEGGAPAAPHGFILRILLPLAVALGSAAAYAGTRH